MVDRRQAYLANFRNDEGACQCGCKMLPNDEIMIAAQAFCAILSRKLGKQIQCRISSGARCKSRDAEIQAAVARAGGTPSTDSQHVHGTAIDCTFWAQDRGAWQQIENAVVSLTATNSGLFGGVGHKYYVQHGLNLVHLDVRHAGGTIATW
jgi:hypothetical protein